MNLFQKIYCRTYQLGMRVAMPMMPYREPEILNSVAEIPAILEGKEINKVLVVTDAGIRGLGLDKGLLRSLRDAKVKYEVFEDVMPNPTIDVVEKGVELYNASSCMAIIALGGGSVIDCAKAIGARIANPNKSLKKMKGLLKVKGPLPLFFAIPTTAGTGSETTVTAVITDGTTHEKYTINDFDLIPNYAVLDASLTLGLPINLTVTTGLDALTHAIEAYIGGSTTNDTRRHALEAARLIFENLPRVCEDGKNERARANMLKASYQAGLAFTKSYVGYVHAVAHTLGGKYGIAHGLANAVLLPYVLGEYGTVIHKKLKVMAVYCNIARPYDNEQIASNKLINKIIEINEQYGIPKTFDCIVEQDIPMLARIASAEANPLYPVPKLMNAKELEKFYYKVKA